MSFLRWIDDKRAEIGSAEPLAAAAYGDQPLSLRTTIGGLASRLARGEAVLDQLRRLHRPDPTGSRCVHDHHPWPCESAVIVGGLG